MKNSNIFGALLREVRVNANRTLKDVADRMEWSVVYLSDIERGKRNPPNNLIIEKLSAFLGVSAPVLLNAADKQRERVELDITAGDSSKADAALMLARKWTDLTPDQTKRIMGILDEEK